MKSILLLTVVLCIFAGSVVTLNIRAITLITRHGDRYPRGTYPNNELENEVKESDLGQLTPQGCLNMFENGKFLLETFPELKERKITDLRSSVRTRCIKSLQCLMAGINGPQSQLPTYKIKTLPIADEAMLNHADCSCPKRDDLLLNGDVYAHLRQNYSDVFDYVQNITGETYYLNDTYFFFDSRIGHFMAQKLLGLKMPSWATDEFLTRAEEALDVSFGELSKLPIQDALNAVFFREVIEKFNSTQDGQVAFFGYATHDTTVAPLMTAVEAWNGKRPLYGEALLFIMKDDGQLEVQFFHQDHKLTKHTIPGCKGKEKCTLTDFSQYVNNELPADWRKACGLKE